MGKGFILFKGQLITMLRQQGITQNLPGAGFIDFVRAHEG